MSGQCAKPSVRRDVAGGVRAERRERVLALDAVLVEVAHAVRAERDRAVLLGADEQEADAGMVAQRRHDARVARVELLERHAPGHRAGTTRGPGSPTP